MRLRDLAGLIVIDFIDMDEKRNNRSVERKLSDCLRQDRARIQVGRISHFGLLEMSRQRIRASVLESSTEPCPQCGGSGHVRSVSSVALQLLRGLEEILMKGATHNLVVRTRTDVALYVLNHKRGHLRDLENSFKVTLAVIADPTVSGQQSFIIDRGEQVHTLEAAKALLAAQVAAFPPQIEEAFDEEEPFDIEIESEVETEETEGLADDSAAGEETGGEAEADGGPSASGGGGGAAVPARRAKAGLRVTRTPFARIAAIPAEVRRLPATTANPTRTKPTNSPARSAPISRRAASGGPAAADAAADAAGAAGRRTVWPDRSRTNSDRHRLRKRPARLPISMETPLRPRCRWCSPNRSRHRPNRNRWITVSRSRHARRPRWRPLRKLKEPPRGGVRPCARR